MRSLPSILPALLGTLMLAAPPAQASSERALENGLRSWLLASYPDALVAVNRSGGAGVRTVVHVFPRSGSRAPTDEDAAAVVAGLRRDVLARERPGEDFAAGSQFLLFGRDELRIEGAGEELRRVLEELARVVVADAGRMGLGVLRLALTGYSGPMASLELRVRGVNLGEAARRRATRALEAHLRDVVFGERYSWVTFLEDRSRVEVVDVRLGEEVEPTGWRYDPSGEIVGRPGPTPELPGRRPTRAPTPPLASGPPAPSLVTVYFDTDRAELRPGDRATLRSLFTARTPARAAAVVVGHADSRNTRAYNRALGLRRARSVGRFLRELGIPQANLELHSHGEDDPVAPNDSPANMQRNRRALVQVLE